MRFVPADTEDILTFLNSDLFIMGMGFVSFLWLMGRGNFSLNTAEYTVVVSICQTDRSRVPSATELTEEIFSISVLHSNMCVLYVLQ